MSKEPGRTFIEASGDILQALFIESMRLREKWLDHLKKAKETLAEGNTAIFRDITPEGWLDIVRMLDDLEKQGYKVTAKTRMHGFPGPIRLDADTTATKKEMA